MRSEGGQGYVDLIAECTSLDVRTVAPLAFAATALANRLPELLVFELVPFLFGLNLAA